MGKIKIKCRLCKTSGLYHPAHLVKQGKAIICSNCNGEGYVFQEYPPDIFTEKAKIPEVKIVLSKERCLGKILNVTYTEFLSGKMP